MEPSPEALDWQRRADAWAQQSESDQHRAVEPANRWSEVASTGRPTFPADGVGWRTETAEWRATGARWRSTTEWRSTTGTHGWRSTTEAWTGGEDSQPPATETPMAQPAISSGAWSDDQRGSPAADSRPAWQQFTDSPNSSTPSWQQSGPSETTAPSRQPEQQPSWQQQPSPRTPAESSPSWQQLVEPTPQPSWNARPSWQRDAIEGSATWTDLSEQRSARSPAPEDTGTTWLRSEDPRDDGRHLVREDDRASWRRDSGAGSPPVGRRRAPESGSAPSGGTGWSAARPESDNWENTDNWARHTDTGSIQLFGETPAPPATNWGTGTGFGSRNVSRRDESAGRRELPSSAYGESPGYQVPPATPYEPPPRPPRRDDIAGARALPAGYDETPRQRFAPDDAPQAPGRYAEDTQGGRRQRGHRYADEPDPGYPRRGAAPAPGDTGSYAPAPRAPRRARPEQDETTTFGAVPMGYGDQSTMPAAPRSAPAAPMPAAPRSAPAAPMPAAPRSAPAAPMPAAPRSAPAAPMPAAPRSAPAAPMPAAPRSAPAAAQRSAPVPPPAVAPRSAPTGAPRSAPTGQGRPKYQAGGADWREQTGSWESEPDTSSWVRDPDTGQWSRSEDDPRIMAWRREAARREAMGEGPRALPAPSDPWTGEGAPAPAAEARPEPTTGGWRNAAQPALPPAPTPRSATPYADGAYGAAPTSSVPSRGYDGPGSADPYAEPRGYDAPGNAPRSAPRDYDTPGNAPRSATPYGERRGYDTPDRASRADSGGYDTGNSPRANPAGYDGPGNAPRSATPYGEPRGYDAPGNAPRSATPYGEPRGYDTPDRASRADSGGYDTPGNYDGPGNTPRSATPYGEPRGYDTPDRSLRADSGGYDSPGGTGRYSEPRDYDTPGNAPRSATAYGEPRGYDAPGNAPRSGTAYGSAAAPRSGTPYGGQRALPSAPRSAPSYGGGAAAGGVPDYPGIAPASGVPGGPLGYSASAPVSAPRSAPGYSGAASVPASAAPADPRYPGTAVTQYDAYGEPQRSARRRAEDDDPPTRRSVIDPTAYAPEPLTPDVWQPGPDPRSGRGGAAARPDDVPPWSRGESTENRQRLEPGAWQLEERRERARGSASYRDGGGADWRSDLADQAELAEGESRRFGTSDYIPFRSGGSAAVPGQSNLSTTSTSLISPVRESAAYPQPAGVSWNGPSGAYERRPVTGGYPTVRKSDLLDPDDEEDEQESGSPLAVVGYTVIWYGVPVVLFIAYMLVVGAGAQGHALGTLAKAAPQFLISLVLSVVVAIGLRFVSHSWKAISVGLAAAVVGGGLATVLTSAITGNSLS